MHYDYPLSGSELPDHNPANQRDGQRVGSAVSPFSGIQTSERCSVLEVYPDRYTCDVFTERGRFLAGVSWPGVGASIHVPRRGDTLQVSFDLGIPVLTEGTVSTQRSPDVDDIDDVPELRVSPVGGVGGDDAVYGGTGSGNARGNSPRDVLPGDRVQLGDLGQMTGLLTGGVVMMKANDMAQVIATQARNLLRLVGQNFELYTGAGSLEFVTDEGKTSMVLRAGADSETESSPDAENYRIRCELGAEGELVDFRVTDGKGRALYRHYVDPDGRVETEARRRTDVIGEDLRTEIGAGERRAVGGDQVTHVGGSSIETVAGAKGVDAGGGFSVQSGADASVVAMNEMLLAAGKQLQFAATGSVVGTDPAMLFTVANGDVKFDIGRPVAGDAQIRRSGFDVNTLTGKISLGTTLGKVELNAGPGNTKIGGMGSYGPYNAVVYEMLQVFMNLFGNLIDTHTHAVPSIVAVTGPPLIPPYASSQGSLRLAKSNFVKLGG